MRFDYRKEQGFPSAAKCKGKVIGDVKVDRSIRIPGARSICSVRVVKLATRISPVPTLLEHVRLFVMRSLKLRCINCLKI